MERNESDHSILDSRDFVRAAQPSDIKAPVAAIQMTNIDYADLRGKRVTIAGMGQTAVSAAGLLLQKGAIPFVTDANNTPAMNTFKSTLSAMNIEFESGGHSDRAFNDADIVISSPGVSPHIPSIADAARRGIPVVGEMEFSFPFCRSKLLAVTGTNGKTTTTELLRTIVAATGATVVLAGNNAFPFSAAVRLEPAPEYIVLEVSSYQLELAQQFRPWIGCVLNLTPDHLQRHGTMEVYGACKARMFAAQTSGDAAVLNADDSHVREMARESRASKWAFSQQRPVDQGLWLEGESIRDTSGPLATLHDSQLRGRHNTENVLAALTMCRAANFTWERVLEGLRSFKGVEHRIEFVRELGGVKYFNDSKSTNLDSLRVALESFPGGVVLLAGGRGKGSDYRVMRPLVRERVRSLIVYGEDAEKLKDAYGDIVDTQTAADLCHAVTIAHSAARESDVVLLSPACASFDMFDNFEHRGRVFKELVLNLKEKTQR
jgi:UDP-N-acetylmuramoylalanine--D-glutamate ligase